MSVRWKFFCQDAAWHGNEKKKCDDTSISKEKYYVKIMVVKIVYDNDRKKYVKGKKKKVWWYIEGKIIPENNGG